MPPVGVVAPLPVPDISAFVFLLSPPAALLLFEVEDVDEDADADFLAFSWLPGSLLLFAPVAAADAPPPPAVPADDVVLLFLLLLLVRLLLLLLLLVDDDEPAQLFIMGDELLLPDEAPGPLLVSPSVEFCSCGCCSVVGCCLSPAGDEEEVLEELLLLVLDAGPPLLFTLGAAAAAVVVVVVGICEAVADARFSSSMASGTAHRCQSTFARTFRMLLLLLVVVVQLGIGQNQSKYPAPT